MSAYTRALDDALDRLKGFNVTIEADDYVALDCGRCGERIFVDIGGACLSGLAWIARRHLCPAGTVAS